MKFFLPVMCWLFLVLFEWSSLLFQQEKPMYFRAWEYVINNGKDSFHTPFQPHKKYDGYATGDLLQMTNFLPKTHEKTKQLFIVDEYGFRNEPQYLQKPISAVLMGTSFVGGAKETQSKLVSNLLESEYGIRTYNYATQPLQSFWEDERFIKNPPKFVIVLGSEIEILEKSYIETLNESDVIRKVPLWNSWEEWKNENVIQTYDYRNVQLVTKRFSVSRHAAKQLYRKLINFFLPRSIVAGNFTVSGAYDPMQDFIFYNANSFDPHITDSNRKKINEVIQILQNTQEILKKRDITLIVATMPAKESVYLTKFKTMPIQDTTLWHFEQALSNTNINYISLSIPIRQAVQYGKLVYYADDSHWNYVANEIIAELVAKKILYSKP